MNISRPKLLRTVMLQAFLSFLVITALGLASYNDAEAFTTDPFPACVATNQYGNGSLSMHINSVEFDGKTIMPYYSGANYIYRYYNEADKLLLFPGNTYDFTVISGQNGSYSQNIKIYIDYNHDNQFSESEAVYYYQNTSSGTKTINGTIAAVPTTALFGEARMRIISEYGGYGSDNMQGCNNGERYSTRNYVTYYGSIVDFTVNIVPPPDAGITGLAKPDAAFLPGEHEVSFTVFNYGAGDLFECPIQWSVDGKDKNGNPGFNTYMWYADTDPAGAIPAGESREIVVGKFDFQHKVDGDDKKTWEVYELFAQTDVVDDLDNTNDAMIAPYPTLSPAMEPGEYQFGGVDPDFTDKPGQTAIEVAMAYMSAAGIVGNGDVTFVFAPETYNGIIKLENLNNPQNQLVLKTQDGATTKAKIMAETDAANPYLFTIANSSNICVENMEFNVSNTSSTITEAGVINMVDSKDIKFYSNKFVGRAHATNGYKDEFNTVMNISNSTNVMIGAADDATKMNIFEEGAVSISEFNDQADRDVCIYGNQFKNFQWMGIRLVGNNTGAQNTNNVKIKDNQFINGNPNYHPNYGINSLNGTTIENNRISGITADPANPTMAIYVEHNAAGAIEQTTIKNNVITGCTDITGIHALNMPLICLEGNDISIDSDNSDTYEVNGICLVGSGRKTGTSTNEFSMLRSNKVRILNATTTDNGIEITNATFAKLYYNDVNMNNAALNTGTQSGLLVDASTAYIANNWFSGNNVNGVILNNVVKVNMLYNAVNINAANQSAIAITGGMTDIRRNLFINNGTGLAVYCNETKPNMVFEQNNLSTEGTNIAVYIDGVPSTTWITALRDVDNVLLSDDTMTEFETVTETGNAGALPTSSIAYATVFEADDVLLTTEIVEGFVFNSALPFAAFGYGETDPETETLRTEIEKFGWNGQERKSKFSMGTNNIVPTINIQTQPSSVVDCWGVEDHKITVVAWISGGIKPKYQWYKDGKPLTDMYDAKNVNEDWANKPILYLDDMIPFRGFGKGLSYDMQGVYTCKVSGGAAEDVFTEPVLVNVLRTPEFTRQPESKISKVGGTVLLEAEAQIFGNVDETDIQFKEMFDINVQWYDGRTVPATAIDEDVEYYKERFVGGKSSILQIKDLQDNDFHDKYFVEMVGHCGTIVSEEVAITKMAQAEITTQPVDVVVCENETSAKFEVVATVDNPEAQIMYQWRSKDASDNYVDLEDGAVYSGVNSATLTVLDIAAAADTYNVLLTVTPGDQTTESVDVTLTTKESATVTAMMPENGELAITPDSGTFTLAVEAAGDNVTYAWYHVVDGTPSDLGVSSATLTVESGTFTTEEHGGEYYCMVTNECGSDQADFTVTVAEPGIIFGVNDDTYGFGLNEVVPNPVVNSARIDFSVETATEVRIVLSDASGKEVAELFNATTSGQKSIDLSTRDLNLNSGVYYYTMIANGKSITRKLIVVK